MFIVPFTTVTFISTEYICTSAIVQAGFISTRMQLVFTVCPIITIPAKTVVPINLINTRAIVQTLVFLTLINVNLAGFSRKARLAAAGELNLDVCTISTILTRVRFTRFDYIFTVFSIVAFAALALESKR